MVAIVKMSDHNAKSCLKLQMITYFSRSVPVMILFQSMKVILSKLHSLSFSKLFSVRLLMCLTLKKVDS